MYEIVLEVEDVRVIGRNANVHVDHFGGLYVFELVAMLLGLYAAVDWQESRDRLVNVLRTILSKILYNYVKEYFEAHTIGYRMKIVIGTPEI